MEALKTRLEATRDGLSIHSSLLAAIDYTLNHWSGLILFLDDGRLEPGTDIVDRSIRQIGIGRRNSLFAGGAGGAETWRPGLRSSTPANSMASIRKSG